MHEAEQDRMGRVWNVLAITAVLLATVLPAIALVAPRETTMGDAQRIVYIHVPLAWLALLGLVTMAVCGAVYLTRRNLAWDRRSQAAAEVGWLCCGLTLLSGALWAHAAWGIWWTWDPRLTSAFVLWLIYSTFLMLRTQFDEAHLRARLSAVFAIVGLLDVPMVIVAAHWFRGIHPAAAAMEPAMRAVLVASVAGFSVLFVVLMLCRAWQLRLQAVLEAQIPRADFDATEMEPMVQIPGSAS